ncbi:MAG TPA: hypothetical protein VEB22_09975 [Phycisphaerales bacterium]|nr:hypothetical protein [Phycisphaerales bacterium]
MGCSIKTVTKLVEDLGAGCQRFHNYAIRALACKRVQCDETWAFVCAKQKNLPDSMQGKKGVGSVWT